MNILKSHKEKYWTADVRVFSIGRNRFAVTMNGRCIRNFHDLDEALKYFNDLIKEDETMKITEKTKRTRRLEWAIDDLEEAVGEICWEFEAMGLAEECEEIKLKAGEIQDLINKNFK